MKKLLISLLVLFPLFSVAQNWQSVRMNDTTYYTIPAANDYLRVIWIDSVTASGNDSVFHFYPSIRLGNTTTNCLDTLGPTWLGKNFIKKANGDEVYFNRWLDTILLKPTSALNATWLMHTDTANNEYRVTISSIDTMTIDNALDSIKELTITVFNNNVPITTNVHHNIKMVLSKAHGFVDCLEWYGFPEAWNNHNLNDEVFLNSSDVHKKVPQKYYVQPPYKEEINFKYQTGNYWQYHYIHSAGPSAPFYIPFEYYIQDSILSIHTVNSTLVDFTYERKNFTRWTRSASPDSLSRSSVIIRDTIFETQTNNAQLNHSIFPEQKKIINGQSVNHDSYYLNTMDCDRVKISIVTPSFGVIGNHCFTKVFPLGNIISEEAVFWYGFGLVSKNTKYLSPINPPPSNRPHQENLIYAKLNGCSNGIPINFIALNTADVLEEKYVSIYPNPTTNKIYLTPKNNTKVISAKLFSLEGKQIVNCENCNELNTATIANGLYILNIDTDKGKIRKKIVVQH